MRRNHPRPVEDVSTGNRCYRDSELAIERRDEVDETVGVARVEHVQRRRWREVGNENM